MNRITKIVWVLGISTMWLGNVNGQTNYLPNITPPSPTAYELGKYGEIPVGLFTGTPEVDIPLYSYRSRSIEVPISLSYRSNGIKVDQLSSNMGLGWSLNAGGAITRMIRDEVDENRIPYPEGEPRGLKGLSSPLVAEYLFNAGGYEVDSEPDLYRFNFMGYTGSFVVNDNGKIIMVPVKDLHIERYVEDSRIGFKIIDAKGYEYVFLDTELTSSRSFGQGHVPPKPLGETAWYLSKIRDIKNGHQVNFHYSAQSYSYILSKTEQLKVAHPLYQNNCPGYAFPPGFATGAGYEILPEISNTLTVAGKQLNEISTSNGEKIIFSYASHPAISGHKMVTAINVFNKKNTPIQSFSFQYLQTINNRVFLERVSFLNSNKNYTLEYIDPEGLAPRLSKAQDHWGYFNGKLNNRYWFPNPESLDNINISFNTINIGADKSINSLYAEKGLLRKIVYPTKGYTEFQYEQNTYWDEVVIPATKKSLNLNVQTDELLENVRKSDFVHLDNIPVDHEAEFYIDVSFNSYDCSEDLLKSTATFLITDETTGTTVSLFEKTQNGGVAVTGTFRYNSPYKKLYANLKKGHSYKLELTARYFCTIASASITYSDTPPTVKYTNIPSGGKRIKKILSKENSNAAPELITYYYGKKEQLNISSGVKGVAPYYFAKSTFRKACIDYSADVSDKPCDYVDIHHLLLSSDSLRKLFYANLFTTYYKYVSVSKGGADFELGGEENEFIVHEDYPGNPLLGNPIQYAPLVNAGWSNGLLRKNIIFKKNELGYFTKLSETYHSYRLDPRLSTMAYGYSIRKKFNFICSPDITHTCSADDITKTDTYNFGNIIHVRHHPCFGKNPGDIVISPDALDNLDIMEYSTNSYWFYRDNTIQKIYDANGYNPIETITNFFYDNPKHKQLTKTTTTTSNGKTITKKLYYPDDVTSTTSLPGGTLSDAEFQAIKQLQTPTESNPNAQHRIGEVVQEVTEVTDAKGSATVSKRNNYANWGNNQILPKSVQTLKGAASSTGLEERAVFHRYDSSANPLEVSQKDGMHTVYLYGYSKQYPIAQIQNTTFSEIATALGVSEDALEDFNENHIGQINGLRAKKPDWMITTYTHIPLVGVKTITDPKGYTTTYEYDEFNRLKHIKDHNGDILEAYDYHYKNE